MAVERSDVDWAREISENRQGSGGRNEAFDSGATRPKPKPLPAPKPKNTQPAQTVIPAKQKRKWGFL